MINYDIQMKVASTQMEPVHYDAHATISKMISFIEEAANNKAELIAFGECIVPGYFYHVFTDPAFSGMAKYDLKLMQNSLELDGPEMKRLMLAAKDNNIYVVTGYVERYGGSRYMSQIFINNEGEILGNRRKLKPTHAERTVCGDGSGEDLKVIKTPLGIIGGTQCWEHTQPLITYAMNSMNEQIHIASWPGTNWGGNTSHLDKSNQSAIELSRVYGMQTQSFTLVASGRIGSAAVEYFCEDDEDKKAMLGYGGGIAKIFGPGGELLSEALPEDQDGIVYADIDLNDILKAKAMLDPVGHYSRPDIFCLNINKNPNPHTNSYNNSNDNEQVDVINEKFDITSEKTQE